MPGISNNFIIGTIIVLVLFVLPPSLGAALKLSSTGQGVLAISYVGIIVLAGLLLFNFNGGHFTSKHKILLISSIVLYAVGFGLAFGLYLPSSSSQNPALFMIKPIIFTNNNQIADLTKIASDFTSISTSINTASNTQPLVEGIDNSNTLLSLFKTRLTTASSNIISQIQIDIKEIPVNDLQYPGSTTAAVQHITNVNKYYALFTTALTSPATL